MKHPETAYCTGCEVEVLHLKAAVISLLADRKDGASQLKVMIPYTHIDLMSTHKLNKTCDAAGVAFEIFVTHHMGS